jgi:hypothetical protein
MDAHVYPRESCHWMPRSPIDSCAAGFTPHQHHVPPSASPLGGQAFGTLRALIRLVNSASKDILCWHGGGDCSSAVDGTPELTEDDLFSLDLVEGYFDEILELHKQLMSSLRWDNRFREGACGRNTRGALKHPAWDPLSNTSPEGWIEFFKSLCHNAMNFGIVLIPFKVFDMAYCDKGHGLRLCGLGIHHYRAMGCSLFSVLQQLLPSSDMYICSQLESVANDS